MLFLPQGVRCGVSGVRGSVLSCFQQSAQTTRFEHVVFADWFFGYCLIAGGGQAVVRESEILVITKIFDFRTTSAGGFGIRSVPTDS
jgi:hypothetical protein